MHRLALLEIAAAAALSILAIAAAHAQTVRPPVTPPKEEKQKSIVVNPTEAQCKQGWSADLKWTKEEFEAHCIRIQSSK